MINKQKVLQKVRLIQTLGLFSIIWIIATNLMGVLYICVLFSKGTYLYFIPDVVLATALGVSCIVEFFILIRWVLGKISIL